MREDAMGIGEMNLNIGGAEWAVSFPEEFMISALPWIFDDGGRSTYFVGSAGDCVTRAIAVGAGLDYRVVYDDLADRMARLAPVVGRPNRGKRSARNGIPRAVYVNYLARLGWDWHPTMTIGSGCKVHLAVDEVPMVGRVIVRLSKHLTCLVDGVVHDTHDPGRAGTRCVYGYWTEPDRTLLTNLRGLS